MPFPFLPFPPPAQVVDPIRRLLASTIFGPQQPQQPPGQPPLNVFGAPRGQTPIIAPQRPNEPNIAYGPRALFEIPGRAMVAGVEGAASGLEELGRYYMSTPQSRAGPMAGPGAGAPSTAGGGPASVAAVLSGGGMPSPVVAGFLGNFHLEGGYGGAKGDGGVSGGIAQWNAKTSPDRVANFERVIGKPISQASHEEQARFVLWEMQNPEKAGMTVQQRDAIMAARTPEEAASLIDQFYERSSGQHRDARMLAAAQWARGVGSLMQNPYDPTFDKAALNTLQAAHRGALTPWSTSMNIGPAPQLPKPEAIPTTDFSKADAALEAMRPVEMSEQERLRRERTGFFQGIAKAMMQANPNDGLGTFLMRLGGAALGGRMAARDEIEQEQDKFDERMARFNAAVFQNEWQKARIVHEETTAQINQNNEYNQNNWKVAYDRWLKNGAVDISGSNVVKTFTDEQGNRTVSVVPITPAVNAAFAQQYANIFSSMGGRQMAGQQQITGMTNAIIGRAAIQAMSGGGSAAAAEADGAAAAAPAFYATYIATNGLTADLLGDDGAKSLEESVGKQLMGMGLQPGTKEWLDRRDRMVANELAKLGIASPDIMKKMMGIGSVAGSFEALDAVNSRKLRRTTDPKSGLTTETETMNAADVFGM